MPGKRVAIVQSSYVPWKGYFDLIRSVDAFILLDDVQFTKRDWRSRNRIKTHHGLAWLSIPVNVKGKYTQLIRETTTADEGWGPRHWQQIRASYAKAPYFGLYAPALEALYAAPPSDRLSDVNHAFLTTICGMLDIPTPIAWSSDYAASGERTARLVDLCRAAGGDEYLSGPSARAYIDETAFAAAGIRVRYADYAGYPEYPQLHGAFEHHVSVLDLLFSTGTRASEYMKRL